MQVLESQWLGRQLARVPDAELFPLLDIGSSTLEYRTQQYQRLIKVAGQQVPRLDRRVAAGVNYDYTIGPRTFIRWTYAFERRRSNDPDKAFFAPIAAMTVHYQLR